MPHEMVFGNIPNIPNLKVFGCICYRNNNERDKTKSRANKCIFLGYSTTTKAYRVFDIEDGKLVTAVDVKFLEKEILHPHPVMEDMIETPPIPTNAHDDERSKVDETMD
ncbi:Aste57867_4336 [Aphanomyces stellatus]|uniref:Aste57867_323 protein n=1 Tax=Aphanomyces stellatus TaxID=120398 RepID=A0A485K4U3_9STRA|nr:hypothetical protein As57867_004325 [Aphanomyces stellatus]KAF0720393.1 hypothetical protein As57867_000323 [Aphanomyces stellatus]VFT77549.1 Aste57867_323 [Aphanomyces stellatus]VFT81450.1 Aste57867_4336 [Aphanomyces stellatus]